MGRIATAAIMLAFVLLLSERAQAFYLSGNDLKQHCESKEGSFNSGVCSGYIIGIVDSEPRFSNNSLALCVPSEVTTGQLRAMVMNYLKENPQLLHRDAGGLVLFAIAKHFVCR